ncbi:MAG: hypothetical protein J1E79_03540 [Rikenella sp.]|nr:hypothetical protein [Rikenella sp.]
MQNRLEGYPYRHVTNAALHEFPMIQRREFVFTFRDDANRRYVVHIEEYRCHVFAVKFHQKNHADSDLKYRLLTDSGWVHARRAIHTCINIMLDMYERYPTYSFGLVGSARILDTPLRRAERSGTGPTQRFRIYSLVMRTYFSEARFVHLTDERASVYLLFNRDSDYPEEEVQTMYRQHIRDLICEESRSERPTGQIGSAVLT